MPPRRKATNTPTPDTAKEVIADEGKTPPEPSPDEAQTELPAPPPVDAPTPQQLQEMATKVAALWTWALPDDGPTMSDEINTLGQRLAEARKRIDENERLMITHFESVSKALEAVGRRLTAVADDVAFLNQRVLSAEPAVSPEAPAIYAAMWGVMNVVQGIGKHGQMEYGERYTYRKYDDLKRELGAACRTHGIMLQSEVVSVVNGWPFEKDPRKTRVQVHMRYRFTSLVDGSTVTFEALGESIDTSDKATGKAQTMALKTALDQAFMLAAEDIDDPDAVRPGDDDIPREQRQARRDETVQRQESRSAAPAYPNDRQKDTADPWDQGPPAQGQPAPYGSLPGDVTAHDPVRPPDTRTPEEKAQAAADKLGASGLKLKDWTAISKHAQDLELMEIPVKVNGQEMALKHYMVAVGRTVIE